MATLVTNRDFYLAVNALCARHESHDRSLEQYLIALLGLVEKWSGRETISLDEFFAALSAAFEVTPALFDETWRKSYERLDRGVPGFAGWRATIIRQIVDLREMAESGALADEQRYFGIDAPRGGRWYNFDIATYLECGVEGSIGGWEPGDDSGRGFVPGEVAVMNADGKIVSARAEDIERQTVEILGVSWEGFHDVLNCGQYYE